MRVFFIGKLQKLIDQFEAETVATTDNLVLKILDSRPDLQGNPGGNSDNKNPGIQVESRCKTLGFTWGGMLGLGIY